MIITLLASDLYISILPIHGKIGLMVNSLDIDPGERGALLM